MSFIDTISNADFMIRMLDYVQGRHSLPESAAVEDEERDQEQTYGAQWNRTVCNCKRYNYEHGGCPRPAAS
jgi:hypothetical protein